MVRWSWTQTPKGNWICTSGSFIAVAEWQGACWELRIKTDHDTVRSSTLKASSPAELESAMQHMIQEIARQSAEMHLLDYEPAALGWADA